MSSRKTERVFRSPAEFRRTMFPEEAAVDATAENVSKSGPGSALACEVLHVIAAERHQAGNDGDDADE